MAIPETLREVLVSDGRGGSVAVKKGNEVKLSPPTDTSDSSTQRHYESNLRFLEGEGPFTVSWIGKWPCGREVLYLKLPNGREPGAYASDFQAIKQEIESPHQNKPE